MAAFTESIRLKLGKRLSPISEPANEAVPIHFGVRILSTDPIELVFPAFELRSQCLLQEAKSFGLEDFNASLLQATETTDETSLLGASDIAQIQFAPLCKGVLDGKHYNGEKGSEQQILLPVFGLDPKSPNRDGGYRKAVIERKIDRNHIERKVVGIWDMLLPLLQPPIDQAFIDVLDLPPGCMPYPYQWDGIKFLIEHQSALLGDDMGTGKTVQSALACRLLFQRGIIQKALIVTPLSVLRQWDRELEKWAPSLTATVVRGTRDHRMFCWANDRTHLWITTYDTIRQDIDEMLASKTHKFDLVILDEAQKIKNSTSEITKAIRKLDCRFRWALTGTPIETRIAELATIFAFLKRGLFPNHDVSPEQAKRIIAPHFLRRRKEDVLKDLPSKEEFPIRLRLDDKQQETYTQMERDKVVELQKQGKAITAQNILTLIGELKKICNRDPVTGASAKLDWVEDHIPDICESGDKVLIFSQYRQEMFGGTDWLAKELKSFGTANYSEADTDRKKNEMLSSFERDPGQQIFLGHPRTAGLGLNQLVIANYVIHFDHWWNPAVTNQATARAHRPNQTKKVFVYHLWVEDTIEELILQKTIARQKLFDEVIDSLSSDATKDVLFEIYDDLLTKHGFKPLQQAKPKPVSAQVEKPEGITNTPLSPRDFEVLISKLFTAMGYNTKLTQYSRDGGVDVIAFREVGPAIEKIAIQCKYQNSTVGRPTLQNLLGVVSADTSYSYGILVTNAEVSKEALDLVRQNGRLRIITGIGLVQMFKKHGIHFTGEKNDDPF